EERCNILVRPVPYGRLLFLPHMPRLTYKLPLLLAFAIAGCAPAPQQADPQLVAQWLRKSLAFVRSERLGPPIAARISAYGSIAAAQIAARRAAGVSGDLRERSIHHGRALGAAILAWAATDGFLATRDSAWKPPTDRALWVNTVTTDQFVPQLLSGESDIVLA